MTSPLASVALFHLGPVPITSGVVVTWAIMAVLAVGGMLSTRRLSLRPSRTQAALELIVETMDAQIRDTTRTEPAPYRAFIGTLFVGLAMIETMAIYCLVIALLLLLFANSLLK